MILLSLSSRPKAATHISYQFPPVCRLQTAPRDSVSNFKASHPTDGKGARMKRCFSARDNDTLSPPWGWGARVCAKCSFTDTFSIMTTECVCFPKVGLQKPQHAASPHIRAPTHPFTPRIHPRARAERGEKPRGGMKDERAYCGCLHPYWS